MTKTQKTVFSALFAALTCVATMIIKVPSPLGGYINLGDCIVLLSGWLLGPVYGFFAAAVGSMLADVLASYFIYAPATFVIKGLMALVAYYIAKNKSTIASRIIAGVVAEILMIALYYIFEGFMYGFVASIANIPANAVQGVFGIILGVLLSEVFKRTKVLG